MRAASALFTAFYALIAAALVGIAVAVTGSAVWDLAVMLTGAEFSTDRLLERVTLVVIAMAIIDVGKYLWEEEVMRDRELRSAAEARHSLTKFMVIICIAVSLEALLHIARVRGESPMSGLVYPAALLVSAVIAMVGLGVYQKLSTSVERKDRDDGERPDQR
ncbi:MAG: hypothetical protein ACM3SS_08640 [Rhodospirillaceae bacterium]